MGSGSKFCMGVSAKISARRGQLAVACVPAGMGVVEDLAFMSGRSVSPCHVARVIEPTWALQPPVLVTVS